MLVQLAVSVPCGLASAAERLAPGASSCLACHAVGPAVQDAPADLATLTADEIEGALAAYRSGARDGTVMPRIAKGFTASEAHAIAVALVKPGEARR